MDLMLKIILKISVVGLSLNTFAGDLDIVSPGSSGGKDLKSKLSGVPTWTSKGGKSVPKLDIGSEPSLKAGEMKAFDALPPLELKTFTLAAPPTPVNVQALLANMSTPSLKEFTKPLADFHAPPVKDLLAAPDVKIDENALPEVVIKPFSSGEEKLLQALIYLDIHKTYPLATGLLSEIMTESKDDLKTEAEFHYGRSALALGLPNEHRYYMTKALTQTKRKDLQKNAALELAKAAQADDLELVPLLDKKLDELNLDVVGADQYAINRARYYSNKTELGQAIAALDEVDAKSPLYSKAQFLRGLLAYRTGKVDEAKKLLADVVTSNDKLDDAVEFKSVAALTLARMQFQTGNYKEAFQSYLKVHKGNPLWMQAMVEQAWAQILSEDYEGAAGNMYTLHTDFFKHAFSPQSYVVRAVGYLNLCQFGDGAKVVYSLNHRYLPMKDMLEQYQTKNKSESNYYETVKTFFKNPDIKVIDGLHRNFVYELAKNPNFMNEQRHINGIEDQVVKYNNLSIDLVDMERNLLHKQDEVLAKIKTLQDLNEKSYRLDFAHQIEDLQKSLASLKAQHQIAKRARQSIKDYRSAGIDRMDEQKVTFKKSAGTALRTHFSEMLASLNKTIDQADVLHYELYSGAGEHLRFQLAGGQLTDKERETLKVPDNKAMKWDFIGEVWEDELGHYRSNLKNVCPKNESDKLTQK